MSNTVVVGAGVVGLTTALYLRRAGRAVTVVDPLGPAGGASFGNSGMISADGAYPMAMPGMLRRVPGWLLDRNGPLVVRPSYLPTALPWLIRWIRAGQMHRVMEISDALRALHKDAFVCWSELLGSHTFATLVRRTGQIQLWDGDGPSTGSQIEQQIRQRHGIESHVLAVDEFRRMVPGISKSITRANFIPGNGYTVSPARLVSALADELREAGGMVVAERAMKLIPRDGGGYTVMTNVSNWPADDVVVAAGAWSGALIEPLGVKVPLETERGYHVMLPDPSVDLRYPLSYKSRGLAATPMEGGLRVAGTVEFAGLDAPPDESRALKLIDHARALFPDLTHGEPRLWMGFRPSLPDSLPVLGPVPSHPRLHLAFGHGHTGMTGGPQSGRLVAALVTGAPAPIDPKPYCITRFTR